MDPEMVDRYERIKLAMITGWTMDVIDNLGTQDKFDILQVYAVEQRLRSQ